MRAFPNSQKLRQRAAAAPSALLCAHQPPLPSNARPLQALSQEGLANYFTRKNEAAAARLWAELLHLTLAASTQLGQPQLYYLADLAAAAVVQQYPDDRVSVWMRAVWTWDGGKAGVSMPHCCSGCPPSSPALCSHTHHQTLPSLTPRISSSHQLLPQAQAGWHRGSALVRLAKLAPWGKWRALREALLALDRQKAAFAASHGPFLYLAALGVAPAFRGAGLGSVLLDHIFRMADDRQLCVYAEATSDRMRRWLRASGFSEQMSHSVRAHAPTVVVMVRVPSTLPDRAGHRGSRSSGTGNGAAGGGGGGGGSGAGSSTGQQQAPAPAQQQSAQARPAGSVRTR